MDRNEKNSKVLKRSKFEEAKNLEQFAGFEFAQLAKKHLALPVRLFSL